MSIGLFTRQRMLSSRYAYALANASPALPTVHLSSAVSHSEGDSGTTTFTYTVTRSDPSGAVNVPWSFSAGSTSANDFVGGSYPTGGTVSMADGIASVTFSVSVQGDTTIEGDEAFTVSISAPSGYALGAPSSATGTILNDDSAPTPTVTISSAISQDEGDSGTTAYTYTVTRSDGTGAVSVPWAFSAGTTSSDDFVGGSYPAGGTVDMADGVASGTFTINVQGDTTVESDESFTVSLTAPAGYALGSPSSATGTILNDDTASAAPTKVIFDGDSITYFTIPASYANQWIANNSSVPAVNLAQAGAKIEGANSLTNRIPDVVSEADGYSPILCILIGANDLSDLGIATWESQLQTYLSSVRSAVPGIIIGVGLVTGANPDAGDGTYTYSRPNLNTYRATVNPYLRGEVGSTIDFIIPFGEHPILGTDDAYTTGAFQSGDGLHWSAAGHSYALSVLNAVLTPLLADATGANPTPWTFSDFATADPSTQYTTTVTVTGMGMGQSANAVVTDSGDVARGTGAFSTGPTPAMNGDILTDRVTTTAGATDLTQHTLTVGSVSDTWDITNAAASATTVFDEARSDTDCVFDSDREVYGLSSVNAPQKAFADAGKDTGKWYLEFTFYAPAASGGAGIYQVALAGGSDVANANRPGMYSSVWGTTYRGDLGRIYNNGSTINGLPTFGVSDTIGIAFDADTDTVWFLKNGVSINGDPAAGTGGYALTRAPDTWYPCAIPQREDGHKLNCGQDPFNYTPPTGFSPFG